MRRALESQIGVNLRFTDRSESFGVEIDRGVLLRHPDPLSKPAGTIELTHRQLLAIVTGQVRAEDAGIKIEGDKAQVAEFFQLLGL